MDEIIESLAVSLGLSLLHTAMAVGFIAGFIVRSIFKGRSIPQLGMPSAAPRMTLSESRLMEGNVDKLAGSSLNANGQDVKLTSEQAQQITVLILSGKKIEAIKYLREVLNIGLAEGKSAVELLERKLRA